MADWDARWLGLADEVGSWSKDRSTKVGCIVIGSARQLLTAGYNGFPRRVNDDVDERHERPEKYLWTEHAERNAIYNAARHGVQLQDGVMYVSWFPCADCARAIIQSGIRGLVTSRLTDDSLRARWKDHHEVAKIMLEEAGVEVRIS
jgi:dCMP deaminase